MGKDSSASNAADQAALAQTRLGEQLVGEVTPLRKELINDAATFFEGGRAVTDLPEFRASKSASEAQFTRAKDNIISSTPTGGGLTAALAGLEANRASNQVAFTGDIAGNEVDRALQLATFGTSQGARSGGTAGFLQGQRANAEASQNAAKSQGAGSAAGNAAALLMTK